MHPGWHMAHLCVCAFHATGVSNARERRSDCVLSLPLSPRPHSTPPSPGALQIEESEESDQGKYECVAMNSAGTRYSAPANLYVRGKTPSRPPPSLRSSSSSSSQFHRCGVRSPPLSPVSLAPPAASLENNTVLFSLATSTSPTLFWLGFCFIYLTLCHPRHG